MCVVSLEESGWRGVAAASPEHLAAEPGAGHFTSSRLP